MIPKAQATRILLFLLAAGVLGLVSAGPADAAKARTWMNHAAPFNYLFGNAFDNYQETQLNTDGTLTGFLYVTFTGQTTSDGYPVAIHNNCPFLGSQCQAGWTISGRPGQASYGTEAMLSRDLIWQTRSGDIPQPGSFSLFQMTGLPATTEMTCPCMESMLTPTQPGQTSARTPGYYLQITASQSFCFRSDPTRLQKMADMMIGQMHRLQPLIMEMEMPALPSGGPGGVQEQMLNVMLGYWDYMINLGVDSVIPAMMTNPDSMMIGMETAIGYPEPTPAANSIDTSKTCAANGGYPVNVGVDIASHTNFYRGL